MLSALESVRTAEPTCVRAILVNLAAKTMPKIDQDFDRSGIVCVVGINPAGSIM